MFLFSTFWEISIFLFCALLTSYVYLSWNFDYWKNKGVKHLKPTLLFGNMLEALKKEKAFPVTLQECYNKYRDQDFAGLWIFTKPALVLINVDTIKNVMVKDFKYFYDRPIHADKEVDPLGSNNLFSSKNPYWKVLRMKLTPFFTCSKMKAMFDLIDRVGWDLNEYISSEIKSESDIFNIKQVCELFSTDSISSVAFGIEAQSFKDQDSLFKNIGKKVFDFQGVRGIEFASLFFAPEIAKLFRFKFFTGECSNVLRKVFWDVMKQRKNNPVERNDLINILLQIENESIDEEGLMKLEGDTLLAQAAVFFTGGFETSSTVMSHCLYELALNPQIQEKLHNEISIITEKRGGIINYDVLQEMKYLDMCIKETMRKYPPLGFLDRLCKCNYEFLGTNVEINPGTYIYIPIYALHMDPEYYPNPEAFDPERFSSENMDKITPFTFMPFGDGPRRCIAEKLGFLQSKIGLYHIIRSYQLFKCSKTVDKYVIDSQLFVTNPVGGIHLQIKPRF